MLIKRPKSLTFGTDPVAAELTASLRSASFQPAARADEATVPDAGRALDIDRYYPSLAAAAAPTPQPTLVQRLSAVVSSVRHAIASL
jgi:hypothetical protein